MAHESMDNLTGDRIRLAAYVEGFPVPEAFTVTRDPAGRPAQGEVLVRNHYVSLNPAQRLFMRDWADATPGEAGLAQHRLQLGDVIYAEGVGRVIESRDPRFQAGDAVFGHLGVQDYAIAEGSALTGIDTGIAPVSRYLGVLGYQGLTAYFGVREIARPQAGDTFVVSAAAGAVGNVAGQLARLGGCRVIGIAGGPEKCRWLVETLGFDAAVDHKAEEIGTALRRLAPKGIDIFFDNVGGEMLDEALTCLGHGARVVLCGATSQYHDAGPMRGPSNYFTGLVYHAASMHGFHIMNHVPHFAEARERLAGWLKDGHLLAPEDIVEGGVRAFPEAIRRLFTGENFGKLLLRLEGAED